MVNGENRSSIHHSPFTIYQSYGGLKENPFALVVAGRGRAARRGCEAESTRGRAIGGAALRPAPAHRLAARRGLAFGPALLRGRRSLQPRHLRLPPDRTRMHS